VIPIEPEEEETAEEKALEKYLDDIDCREGLADLEESHRTNSMVPYEVLLKELEEEERRERDRR